MAQAETGEKYFLPLPPDKPDHGLFLSLDARWIDGSGYRPIHVSLITANGKPAPADRRVEVILQPNALYSSPLPRVSQEIKLSQGKIGEASTILVPQHMLWYALSIEVWEDGRKLPELSNKSLSMANINSRTAVTEAYPAMIVFHRNAPLRDAQASWALDQANRLDSGEEVEPFPDLRILFNEQTVPTAAPLKSLFAGSPYQAVAALRQLPRTDVLPLSMVPDNWLALSSADLLVFEWQDLETLQETSPEKFAVIRDWTNAGGNLLVWNSGKQGPSQIDPWFDQTKEAIPHQWDKFLLDAAPIRDIGLLRVLRFPHNNFSGNNQGQYSALAIQNGKLIETAPNAGIATGAEKPLNLATREMGFGKLTLVQENPFPGNAGTWERIFGAIGGSRLAWFDRHGMSRMRENLGFWDFLVPGVGIAPVTTFEVLITLFVIVIGPVNYFVLRAISRLNLLIITVPVGAILITSLLMIYALVSDGFSTQTRIRTLTTLDQQTGQGATWSRQAYYSGMASSSGLTFPTDTAVFEYEQSPLNESVGQKRLSWGKNQVLSGAYFRSRVTQQFLVIRPFQSKRQLEIDTTGNGISVTNKLGTKILALLLVDENGTPHFTSNLNADAQAKLQPDVSTAVVNIRERMGIASMRVPDGFDRQMYINQTRHRTPRSVYLNIPERNQVEPNFTRALMERQYQAQIMNSFEALGPRSYFAVVQHFPETPLGIDGISPGEKSLEVIQATW